MVQVSAATAEPIVLPKVYKNFEDVFSAQNASHLPPHKNHDHAIDLIVDDKQPFYRPIYSLSKNEFPIPRAYIDKNLANQLIRPSKLPANTPILFKLQPNKILRLCIDYRSFNNLTIEKG